MSAPITPTMLREMADRLELAQAAANGLELAITGQDAEDLRRRGRAAHMAAGVKCLQVYPGGVVRLYPQSLAHLGIKEGDYLLSSEDTPGEVTLVSADAWWGPGPDDTDDT